MDLDGLLELEYSVWDALVAGDATADACLLSDDFLGVYPSGFADRDEHAGQLHDGPTVAEYSLHDARLLAVTGDDVLLAYRAEYRRVVAGEPGPPSSEYISSLWSRRGGTWVNVFSQDTPLERA